MIAEVLDYENMDKVNSLDEVDQKKKDYEVEVLDCGEDMKEMGIKCMSFKV